MPVGDSARPAASGAFLVPFHPVVPPEPPGACLLPPEPPGALQIPSSVSADSLSAAPRQAATSAVATLVYLDAAAVRGPRPCAGRHGYLYTAR